MMIKTAESRRIYSPFISISQLRSKKVMDSGGGNFTTFKRFVDIATKAGIRSVCILSINETDPDIASNFNRASMNALSLRYLDIAQIPEIKNNAPLLNEAEGRLRLLQPKFSNKKMHLNDVQQINQEYLNKAYQVFKFLPNDSERKKEFKKFCDEQSFWLNDYAYFNVLKERFSGISSEKWDREYRDKNSEKAKRIISDLQMKMDYFKFVQMELFGQAKEAFSYAREKGIEEIELIAGVGLSRESAEGFLMQDLFDSAYQIGCSEEKENGYPTQLWGFLAEKPSEALMDYKAKSFKNLLELGITRIAIDHACGFLGGYTTFPVFDPDEPGRVLDGRSKVDQAIAERHVIHTFVPGEQEEERRKHAKNVLFSLLQKLPEVKFTAETVGDMQRRVAVEEAVQGAIDEGYDITKMEALPWGEKQLNEYAGFDRLSLTHDMPTLTGLLTGKAGDHKYPWVNKDFVGKFFNKLGILSAYVERPLNESELTTEFMFEIQRRISGSTAGTVTAPVAGFFNLLPKYLDSGKWQYANIQPGTSGEIGNKMGNWENRLPNIEELEQCLPSIQQITGREIVDIEIPQQMDAAGNFSAQIAKVSANSVVYQALNNKWTVWNAPEGSSPVLEFAIKLNPSDEENLQGWPIKFSGPSGIESGKNYMLRDLLFESEFEYTGEELIRRGFIAGEIPGINRNHYVIYQLDT